MKKRIFQLVCIFLMTAAISGRERDTSSIQIYDAPDQTSDIVFYDETGLAATSYSKGYFVEMKPSSQGIRGPVKAEYYSDQNLKELTKKTQESRVFFPFGDSSPEGLPSDRFSARWKLTVVPAYSEQYTFYTRTDDGIRLYVNGKRVIDQWKNMGTTEYTATVNLRAGRAVQVVMEYYEGGGPGHAELGWRSPGTPEEILSPIGSYTTNISVKSKEGWVGPVKADYFSDTKFQNKVLSRNESVIQYNFGNGSPHSKVPKDRFTVRWTGKLQAAKTTDYTFYTITDDGVRLYLDGKQIIDEWRGMSPTEHRATVRLEKGKTYSVVMEYVEYSGGAVAELGWMNDHLPKNPIAQIGKEQSVLRRHPAGLFSGKIFSFDFNGDRDRDIAVLSNSIPGELHLFENKDGELIPYQTLPAGFDPSVVEFLDGKIYVLSLNGISVYEKKDRFEQVRTIDLETKASMGVLDGKLTVLMQTDRFFLSRIDKNNELKPYRSDLPDEYGFEHGFVSKAGIFLFAESFVYTSKNGKFRKINCNRCEPVVVKDSTDDFQLFYGSGLLYIFNGKKIQQVAKLEQKPRCAVSPGRNKQLHCLASTGNILRIDLN